MRNARDFLSPTGRLIMALGALILLLILILVISLNGRSDTADDDSTGIFAQNIGHELKISDFILREPVFEGYEMDYYLSREMSEKWKPEDIERYWFPVRDTLIDIIAEENDRELKRILDID